MLTINADHHQIMNRMHKPDPALPAAQQDKRSVVALERNGVELWLKGTAEEAATLITPPAVDVIDAEPLG
jgi:putative SOS response-associated peptidase YedK